MAVEPFDFPCNGANDFCSWRNFYSCQRFRILNKRCPMCMGTDPADTFYKIKNLCPCSAFSRFFNPTMHISESNRGIYHNFAFYSKFEMSRFFQCRMLGTDRDNIFLGFVGINQIVGHIICSLSAIYQRLLIR